MPVCFMLSILVKSAEILLFLSRCEGLLSFDPPTLGKVSRAFFMTFNGVETDIGMK